MSVLLNGFVVEVLRNSGKFWRAWFFRMILDRGLNGRWSSEAMVFAAAAASDVASLNTELASVMIGCAADTT